MNDYTPEERVRMLGEMSTAANRFYVNAARIGCHAFIEFTGLMQEFLKVCAREEAAGRAGWVTANGHGANLPFHEYEIEYVREKLGCIFGDALFKETP